MVEAQRQAPVSVVVSTLDRPGLLGRCLDAVLSATCVPVEVVVVDQGDPGPAAAVLDARRGGPVRLVHVPQERRGLSASQNLAVAMATSEVVAVVDDDCVVDERWLDVVVRAFAAADGPLLLTGRIAPLPPRGSATAAVSSRTSTTRRTFGPGALPWEVGTGGNFAVHRRAFLAAGGNDPLLGTGTPGRAGNDLDLFARLLEGGVTALYEPDSLVLHERSTPQEHRARRWTYGFGLGAVAGRRARAREGGAVRLLTAWARLRLSRVRHEPSLRTASDEARVLAGTVAGLLHGVRLPPRPRPPGQEPDYSSSH